MGRYAIVQLDDGSAGIAYVDWDWVKPERAVEPPSDAEEAVQLAASYDPVEAAIGVATINALSSREKALEADPLDLVTIEPGSTVALVGYIGPYVRRLQGRVRLYVFEIRPHDEDFVYPWYAEEELLPRADLVIATGVTVVNKTINRIAELSRRLIVVGPTTPMVPEAFEGIEGALAGSRVEAPDEAYRLITLGHGANRLLRSGVLRKVTAPLGGDLYKEKTK